MPRFGILHWVAALSLVLHGVAPAFQPPRTSTRSVSSAPEPPAAARPNILVWMVDDLGFGQLGAYGGLIETPNIDRLARDGLRFSNYHTTPICSASRAALLTGRNPHAVHIGSHTAAAVDQPGYDGFIPRAAGTIAENLRQAGYTTHAIGKWDHLRSEFTSANGPFTYWPSGQGFDHFYGFLSAEANNFAPVLWADHAPAAGPRGTGYHLTSDLADRAIDTINARDAAARPAPFFIYWATGAVHAPHHAPADYLARYRGRFDMGWDRAREEIFRRQQAMGLVPRDAELPPRPEGMPAWDSLSPEERRINARAMEAFAAMMTHADHEFGRILATLEARGELDNTIVLITSDNGASAEGGPAGTFNELTFYNRRDATLAENQRHLAAWGGPETYPHYPVGWAVAGNTPFRYYKQTTYEGGVRVPLVLSWRHGIRGGNGIRNQFMNVSDVVPTLLDAAGVRPASTVNGVDQIPFDGTSFTSVFADAGAAPPRDVQYFELFGNRAIWTGGWKAVLPHRTRIWRPGGSAIGNEGWELYHVDRDINERVNLADREPERLRRMIALFDREGRRNNVFPMMNTEDALRAIRSATDAAMRARGNEWIYRGAVSQIPEALAPPLPTRSFEISARFTVPARANGALLAMGGRSGGLSLYFDRGRPVFAYRNIDGTETLAASRRALPAGAHQIGVVFDRQGNELATARLVVGGSTVAETRISGPLPIARFSMNETFDIGSDAGSAAASAAAARSPFAGEIEMIRVWIRDTEPN